MLEVYFDCMQSKAETDTPSLKCPKLMLEGTWGVIVSHTEAQSSLRPQYEKHIIYSF